MKSYNYCYPVFTLELEQLLSLVDLHNIMHTNPKLAEELETLKDTLLEVVKNARTGKTQIIEVRNETK